MANTLPMIITGIPTLRIEESQDDEEYYGIMTFIRVMGEGEHQQDPHGLVLWLCGKYDPKFLERVAMAINSPMRRF